MGKKKKEKLIKFDENSMDKSLPLNDKWTQTEKLLLHSKVTQTEEFQEQNAEEIALDIVNFLVGNVIVEEAKDETIVTEHIRSVKSTKKILGINTLTTELPKEQITEIVKESKEEKTNALPPSILKKKLKHKRKAEEKRKQIEIER